MEKHKPSGDLLSAILERLKVVRGPDHRGEYVAWCPYHDDGQGKPPHNPNLYINSEKGVFHCHACKAGGSLNKLAKYLGIDCSKYTYEPKACFDYVDEKGILLFQVVRFSNKRFRQRRPDGKGGWIWNLNGVRRVVYNLPIILKKADEIIFIVEGEKDANRLSNEGLLATTNSGGAGKWKREYSATFKDRHVVILPDNDAPGKEHAQEVVAHLGGIASKIQILELPGLPEKGDVSDWLDLGNTVGNLDIQVKRTPQWQPQLNRESSNKKCKTGSSDGDSQAAKLVKISEQENTRLFHDERDEAYAVIPSEKGNRNTKIESKKFKLWLSRLGWKKLGKACAPEVLKTAIQVISSMAIYEGPKYQLHVRCAWHEDAIWIDLDGYRAVQVIPGSWKVVERPPILFRSFPLQKPMPEPSRGGKVDDIFNFLNMKDERSCLLLRGFLVAAFVPGIPIPALVVHGVEGSAKTTLLKIVKRLLDPSLVEVLGIDNNLSEYALTAWQNRFLPYDNLSSLPPWFSDSICRTITGEGWSKRTLYSDEDTTFFDHRRIIGMSGINLIATRSDLLNRSLIVELEPIPPEKRIKELLFWKRFDEVHASIFGGLLDALAQAMEIEPNLQLPYLFRMADFVQWGAAATKALGHNPITFLAAYQDNTTKQNDAAIDESPVAQAILKFMTGDRGSWDGTPAKLLGLLNSMADDLHINTSIKSWPKTASWLSRRLKE